MARDPAETPRGSTGRRGRSTCPLCGEPAVFLDWRPSVEWASIEDCRCDAFFVWTVVLDSGRLDEIPRDERAQLHARILGLRAIQREAWLYTADGTPQGTLVVRMERPE